jgi:hypothetical protein
VRASRGPKGFSGVGTMAFGGLLARYGHHVVPGRSRGTFGFFGTRDPGTARPASPTPATAISATPGAPAQRGLQHITAWLDRRH